MDQYPVIDKKPQEEGIQLGVVVRPEGSLLNDNSNQRDEVEHARIVKERIESLACEVVTEDYQTKVKTFKNNRKLTGLENQAYCWCNIIGTILAMILVLAVTALFFASFVEPNFLGPFIFGCILCMKPLSKSWFVVNPMQAVISSKFHKVQRVYKKQGCYCRPLCCEERQVVSLKVQSIVVASTIPDASGSPMQVSAMVNFRINDPVAAFNNVENMNKFVEIQALDVVLRICGKFRYKSPDASAVTLLEDGHHISVYMRELLQKKTAIAGVEIMRADFIDIAYSTEMTMSLLQVQKAEARLDARAQVVEGAVSITHDALERLKESEMIDLEAADYEELASSLMALTCSDDGNVQAVMRIA